MLGGGQCLTLQPSFICASPTPTPAPTLRPAIIALTDQYLHQRTSNGHYRAWYSQLRDQAAAIAANQLDAAPQSGGGALDQGVGQQHPDVLARIQPTEDYRLVLASARLIATPGCLCFLQLTCTAMLK